MKSSEPIPGPPAPVPAEALGRLSPPALAVSEGVQGNMPPTSVITGIQGDPPPANEVNKSVQGNMPPDFAVAEGVQRDTLLVPFVSRTPDSALQLSNKI